MIHLALMLALLTSPVVTKAADAAVMIRETITLSPYNLTEPQHEDISCSGFVISSVKAEELVISAKHCFADGVVMSDEGMPIGQTFHKVNSIRFFDGDVGTVEDLTLSPDTDLALLTVHSMRSHKALRLAQDPVLEDHVLVFGLAGDLPWSIAYGVVFSGPTHVSTESGDSARVLIPISCPACWHGDSGAPVLDTRGGVVGMLSAGDNRTNAFITPVSDIVRFLHASL